MSVSKMSLGGISGWRLPYISVAAGAGPLWGVYPVDCNTATELDCRDNELGYIFYHNLSGTWGSSILASDDPDLEHFPTLEAGYYWSGTEFDPFYAWAFVYSFGYQPWSGKGSENFTWAVHPGYVVSTDPVDLSGTVQTADGTGLCAMVLVSGRYMFSCDGSGSYALNIPLDTNGQFKLQVYADGFAPTIQVFDEFPAVNDVQMARAVECQ